MKRRRQSHDLCSKRDPEQDVRDSERSVPSLFSLPSSLTTMALDSTEKSAMSRVRTPHRGKRASPHRFNARTEEVPVATSFPIGDDSAGIDTTASSELTADDRKLFDELLFGPSCQSNPYQAFKLFCDYLEESKQRWLPRQTIPEHWRDFDVGMEEEEPLDVPPSFAVSSVSRHADFSTPPSPGSSYPDTSSYRTSQITRGGFSATAVSTSRTGASRCPIPQGFSDNIFMAPQLMEVVRSHLDHAMFVMPYIPPEIVDEILSHITDPQDMRNAMQVCPQWHQTVIDRRGLWRVATNLSLEDGSFIQRLNRFTESNDLPGVLMALRTGISLHNFKGTKELPSPLHRACWLGNVAIVRALMKEGHAGPIEKFGHYDSVRFVLSPLACAARTSNIALGRFLLEECGASPDGEGGDEDAPPIMYTCPPATQDECECYYAGHVAASQFVRLLREFNVNINCVRRGRGKTALAIVPSWLKLDDPSTKEYIDTFDKEAVEVMKTLVECGADVNLRARRNSKGSVPSTPLICAASRGLFDVVEWLVTEANADVMISSGNVSRNALEWAIKGKEIYLAKLPDSPWLALRFDRTIEFLRSWIESSGEMEEGPDMTGGCSA